MDAAGTNIDRTAFLEERVRYLEEANRSYVMLLDILASDGDFQAALNRTKSTEGIYRATLAQLGRFFPFQAMGILINKEDNSFELVQCEPSTCRDELLKEVNKAIMEGTFAWALNRSQALTVPGPTNEDSLLLHVIGTQNRISGMFIGLLSATDAIIDAPALNALSNILYTSAFAMESNILYSMLREHLQTLEERVLERTAELQTARVMAESAAEELKASNEKLCREMADRKRAEDDLIKAQKLESLGVFAGGIAHDFNNILTSILANLSFARMQLSPSNMIAKRLEECEKATVRASELTQQLLTFARGGEPVKKLLNPATLIREAATFILRGSVVRSKLDLAPDLWCVEADGGQLSQSLHNLLINAAQAMPNGGEVTVRGENVILEEENPNRLPPGRYLRITVEDHGCGIPPENLGRIFDPYFTTKAHGSGLGLASVYSIIKRHGGTVGITSSIGVGSRFEILLPASPERRPDILETKEIDEQQAGGRVLIMDDEEFIREIAEEILRFMGYDVESCADGAEAVELYRQAKENNLPFSCVILDLTIPGGMGGKEASTRILEIDPDAVLIVSSGYSNDPIIANYFSYGFSDAIRKPFDSVTLADELKKLTSGKNRHH